MLETLELFGFKSFADRTRFDFAPGVTCVVGPNGSGKSNVVDSIKWILGDQSPKSLRGKEMTDVIFNGASNRKPAGFAEATLTFNNAKRVLSVDADEVQIGRRIYRSGEAEYLINRVPARLKDIRELFLGTGAGTSAYSIIEQGRVDQLLQASATSRRVVFEEAAGISRFKLKKVDAERKLERVGQNLLRLTDIVKEVETQLLAVRSQATKAAKFREYSQELRTLRLGLAADDYRQLTVQLTAIDEKKAAIQVELEKVAAAAQEFETRQQAADGELSLVEDRLRAVERREAENREAIAGHEATVKHQTARKQELQTEFTRLELQQQELTARAQQVAGELEETVDHLHKFADEFGRRKAALAAGEFRVRELAGLVIAERDKLEQLRGEMLDTVRQTSMLGNRVTAVQSQIENLEAGRKRTVQRLQKLDKEIDDCQADLLRQQALVATEVGRMSALREALKSVQDRRKDILADQSDRQQKLVDIRERRSALQARRDLLDDLDRRQEGLGVGVKEILQLARDAKGPPWTSVLGHVVDLLEVDLENAALLEVALGNRAQLIVLDDAEPLLDFLHDGTCKISGRVGFLATWQDGKVFTTGALPGEVESDRDPTRNLPVLARMSQPLPDISDEPGVVNRADRLVRSAGGIHRLAEQLLADTWIVSTLEVALRLAARTGPHCRYVTLQGELLETSGTLYVGSVRSETALVSRKSELRGIKNELQKLDRQIISEESGVAQTAVDLKEIDAQWQRLQVDLDDCTSSVSEVKSAAGSQEMDLERLLNGRAEAELELAKSDREHEELKTLSTSAQSEHAELDARLRSLQETINAGEAAVIEYETQQRALQEQYATEQMDLAKGEERLQNLQHARSRLDQERYQRDLHREEAERRFEHLAAKCQQIDEEIANSNAHLAGLLAANQTVSAEVAELQAERDRARKSRGELSEREIRVRHQLRDQKEQIHALEMKSNEIRHQLTSLAERLRDEYQLELTEVEQSGVSARQDYLDSLAAPGETASAAPEAEPLDDGFAPPAATSSAAGERDEIREIIEEKINRCRRKLKQIGQVNTDSLRALDDLETRFAKLSAQLQDLLEAKSTLEDIIRRINVEGRRMFIETFDEIRKQFQELFRKLFGGGEGDVVLEDPEDVLECGIDIVARPPGKELRSISLLSGGEKTMTAVALLLAIFKSRPSPFCILDEVDAALDEGNVERYLGVIREFQQWTQFIVITHSKRTMSGADMLYGVTMESAGVSKRMSVKFEDIGADGNFKTPAGDSSSGGITTAA